MRAVKIKEIYFLEDGKRKAEITFEMNFGKRRFSHCQFNGVRQGAFTLEDWRFLKELAEEIISLEEEYFEKEVEL